MFGCYRITRFLGWDDWPPIYRVRAWAIGETWIAKAIVYEGDRGHWEIPQGALAPIPEGLRPTGETSEIELPGKQPPSELTDVRPAYSRPTLAHLVHCPFCLGWWVSLAAYASWNLSPGWTLWLIAPFALSGAVGLVARNLDP